MSKTVFEMAREVWSAGDVYIGPSEKTLELFAELVRADEREQGQKWFDAVTAQYKQAILAEREACANLVFNSPPPDEYESPLVAVYKAIRNRSNT